MVDPAIMARVQTNLSVSFSMDAACNPHGTNALCPRYATPSTFTTQCVSGEALWCCAPAHEVREYQQHYERSKRKDPHHTCAVFVVPKFPHLTGYFSQLRYKLVEEFPTGTTLFVSANGGKARLPMPPTPFPVQLWYYPPAVVTSLESVTGTHSRAMCFDSIASLKPAVILVDSGADAHGTADGFISRQFALSLGVSIQPSNTASVRLADGQPHPLLGEVSIPIKMGPFRDTVRLPVGNEGR